MPDSIATAAPEAVTSADLATLPLRIELDHRAQWRQDEDSIRMVSAASIWSVRPDLPARTRHRDDDRPPAALAFGEHARTGGSA